MLTKKGKRRVRRREFTRVRLVKPLQWVNFNDLGLQGFLELPDGVGLLLELLPPDDVPAR
jgi:hypothetical protein